MASYILLTGGTGLVGRYLVRDLISAGMSAEDADGVVNLDSPWDDQRKWKAMAPYWEFVKNTGLSQSIRIDQATGRKVFNTRAAKATDKIAGKGYSIIKDEALKTLPPAPAGAVFNAKEQAKYREFKEARAGAAD